MVFSFAPKLFRNVVLGHKIDCQSSEWKVLKCSRALPVYDFLQGKVYYVVDITTNSRIVDENECQLKD